MRKYIAILFILMLMIGLPFTRSFAVSIQHHEMSNGGTNVVRKLLVIGDSMTGWLGERMNAYGKENGYEVAIATWDGATISKYVNSGHLKSFIEKQNPDAVVICLGMNEMLGTRFDTTLKPLLNKFREAVGDRQFLWVGPPSWPGKGDGAEFNAFMKRELGDKHYFVSSGLKLPRQSVRNPHPTRQGMNTLGDAVMDFNRVHGGISLPGYTKPAPGAASRGSIYIYKRMKEKF